ncbi:hypothetical protein [Phaeobacter sp. 11ANDIMAR09]|uniref:hypothetical protein n=1 Tax=Phaeobacter sp. 11ANDIMAR09 TaxID=1225647 RepID=UPI0006C8E060|nr:hypothetical protein [Phaeobacter sp. 11ANDIMAR09]
MNQGKDIVRLLRRMLLSVACFGLIIWTLAPSTAHVPQLVEPLQEHVEMITSHGHSHGLEEEMMWAMHGHSHDAADHDHTQAALFPAQITQTSFDARAAWRGRLSGRWSSLLYRLDRPPRA